MMKGMKTRAIKTLVWFDGQLILARVPIEDILRQNDERWWEESANLNLLQFNSRYYSYLEALLKRYPLVLCSDIDNVQLGERDGCPITAQRDGERVYVYLHKPNAKLLLLYSRCDTWTPVIADNDNKLVWSIEEITNEFWREYAWRLWSRLRRQSDYIPTDNISVIDVEIRNMMEEQRWQSAMLIADCACHMAAAREDKEMLDYFTKLRDGLRQVMLT